jgi:putative FmdB family regulatory protein
MDADILAELIMPIFEYMCQECDHKFEAIVLGQQKPRCPQCESKRLQQQVSRFAVTTDASSQASPAPGPCGTCGDPRGPGACSMN